MPTCMVCYAKLTRNRKHRVAPFTLPPPAKSCFVAPRGVASNATSSPYHWAAIIPVAQNGQLVVAMSLRRSLVRSGRFESVRQRT